MGIETLAIASLVAGGVGAVVSAVGAHQQGEAAADAARYQAQVANNNAMIAEQNAQRASRVGAEKAAREGMKSRAMVGAAITGSAAAGLDVNSGSPADVIQTNRVIGRLDQEQEVTNAAVTSYGYRAQGTNFTAEAGLDEAKAQQASIAGDVGAFGSLLGNAGSLAGKYAGFQKSGALS